MRYQVSSRWIAAGLFALTILTRLPFASQYLYHWDSVNMAMGMQQYDVRAGAPQFPGYIVYIALAQIINWPLQDAQTTLVLISIVSSGLAVAALYGLGREMFSPSTGLMAAMFLLTSPLFWFYGEIALPHTLDLLALTVAAWLLYRIMTGQLRLLWWTVVWLALIGGFRQQDLLFLLPLIIFAGHRLGIARIGAALLLGMLTMIGWLAPLMATSGGIRAYLEGSAAFTASFFNSTSLLAGAGAFGLQRNLMEKLLPYTLYAWSAAIVPAIGYAAIALPGRWRMWLKSRKVWFLALWAAPAVSFYTLIHMGQQGLVFVFLPALLLVSAEGLRRLTRQRPPLMRVTTAGIALIGAAIFILTPTFPLGEARIKLLNWNAIRAHDRLLSDQITAVRTHFDPDSTLLVAANWRHAQYYLPEYRLARFTLGSRFETTEGQPTEVDYVGQPMNATDLGLRRDREWRIVILDEELLPFAGDEGREQVTLPDGFSLVYLAVPAGDLYSYATDGKRFGAESG